MSDRLIRFDFRFQKSKMTYAMTEPRDVQEFFENLNLHSEDFMYDSDELIVLYPTPEGKMKEIKSNDDIEFLKKNKFCFDFITRKSYCNIELLIIVQKNKKADPNNQYTILSRKIDQLSSQMDDLEILLNNMMEERAHSIKKMIRLFSSKLRSPMISINLNLLNHHLNSKKAKQNDLLNQLPNLNFSEPNFDSQQENSNEKSSLILSSISMVDDCQEINNNALEARHSTPIENQPKTSVNKMYSRKDMKDLIEMLKEQGFTNVLRNIIILVRFDYDYQIALNYLKSNPIL